jgi:hypothetical protein
LTENHIRLLEKFDPEFRERHIKADYSEEFVAIDTFMVGNNGINCDSQNLI